MKLRSIIIIAVFVFIQFKDLKAQTQTGKMTLGLNISQFQKDFGIGIHLISPYFVKSKIAVRAGANIQWLDHISGSTTTWTTYQNFHLGLRSRNSIVEDKVFFYGEGGVVSLLPDREFSSRNYVLGGYGLFGFEFRSTPQFSYFIELGGIGTGATAEKLPTKPVYSNGFLTNVGFRIGL